MLRGPGACHAQGVWDLTLGVIGLGTYHLVTTSQAEY